MKLTIELSDEEADKLLDMLGADDAGPDGETYQTIEAEKLEAKFRRAIKNSTVTKGACKCAGFFVHPNCPLHGR